MDYKKIETETSGYENNDGLEWLKSHCLECEVSHKQDESFYDLYFKFGSNDEDSEFHTDEFGIERNDAVIFISAYCDKLFDVMGSRIFDEHYHIDSLWFASDGDSEDCQYVIKAHIYRKF